MFPSFLSNLTWRYWSVPGQTIAQREIYMTHKTWPFRPSLAWQFGYHRSLVHYSRHSQYIFEDSQQLKKLLRIRIPMQIPLKTIKRMSFPGTIMTRKISKVARSWRLTISQQSQKLPASYIWGAPTAAIRRYGISKVGQTHFSSLKRKASACAGLWVRVAGILRTLLSETYSVRFNTMDVFSVQKSCSSSW